MHPKHVHTFEDSQASSARATILIADDFAEWRARVREILGGRPEWEIIGEACDGLEAVQKALELRPDLVLLDIGMPILNGIEAAKRIRQYSPGPEIIFLTQNNDADVRTAALATGAAGYLLKANVWGKLPLTIEAALRDGRYSPSTATEQKNRS